MILISDAQPSEFLVPAGDRRTSFTLGGVAISDPSQGLMSHRWQCFYQGGWINLRRDGQAAIQWIEVDGVQYTSVAFDQNMRPVVLYGDVQDGAAYLTYFDGLASAYVTKSWAGLGTPFVAMDDPRVTQNAQNNIYVVYTRAGWLRYRLQAERYDIEHDLKQLGRDIRIVQIGMMQNWRFGIQFL